MRFAVGHHVSTRSYSGSGGTLHSGPSHPNLRLLVKPGALSVSGVAISSQKIRRAGICRLHDLLRVHSLGCGTLSWRLHAGSYLRRVSDAGPTGERRNSGSRNYSIRHPATPNTQTPNSKFQINSRSQTFNSSALCCPTVAVAPTLYLLKIGTCRFSGVWILEFGFSHPQFRAN